MVTKHNTIFKFVPQQEAWVIERMGKYHRVLEPGPCMLFPILDKISYVQSLKEKAVDISHQTAITLDNVTIQLDGVLYIKIFDAYKASYGVDDVVRAVSQLSQTAMRSEIGQMTLQQVLRERQTININVSTAINEASTDWGITCLRHEIKDITPPREVEDAMHRQVSAERSKRAEILQSEGHRVAAVNKAEADKQTAILASEGQRQAASNRAEGDRKAAILAAEAAKQASILSAEGTAQGLNEIADALSSTAGGKDALALQLAQQYVEAFGKLAKEGTSVVVPAQLNDIGGMIAGGLSIFDNVRSDSLNGPSKVAPKLMNGH